MGAWAQLNKSRLMMEGDLVYRRVVGFLDGTFALSGGNTPIIAIGFGTAALQAVMLVVLRRHRPICQSA